MMPATKIRPKNLLQPVLTKLFEMLNVLPNYRTNKFVEIGVESGPS